MGVYALRLTGGDKETEDSQLWSELIIDADGMEWETKKAKVGSEVDASGWGRVSMRTADAVRSMVAAAKFEDRTLVLCFAGQRAQDGLAEIEEVVIEEGPDGVGLQERITRRFAGRFLRPLAWQEQIEKWSVQNVGLEWDEDVHSGELLELWRLSMPGTEAPARKDERWNQIGFQQQDPKTDFRGAGMLPLKELILFAKTDTQHYCAMLARFMPVCLTPPPPPPPPLSFASLPGFRRILVCPSASRLARCLLSSNSASAPPFLFLVLHLSPLDLSVALFLPLPARSHRSSRFLFPFARWGAQVQGRHSRAKLSLRMWRYQHHLHAARPPPPSPGQAHGSHSSQQASPRRICCNWCAQRPLSQQARRCLSSSPREAP